MNIAFIPVRCGSKSIPYKNIMDVCGRPLVYWSLLSLEKSNEIDEVFVATDCDKIEEVVKEFNFKKVSIYRRSAKNADDNATTESVVLEFIEGKNFENSDLFMLVQATSPLTKSVDFDKAIELYRQDKADSLLTCVRSKRFFWNEDGSPINYDYKNRLRRQDFEGVLMENGAFYINKVENIKKSKNRLSGKISIYEMEEHTAFEIDELDDVIIVEKLMQKYVLKKTEKPKVKLFLTDVDGTLTDAGMYYGENGDEYKKFNTHDGKGLELLRNRGIKVGIITSENTKIVERRAKKLKVDYLYQGLEHKGKLEIAKDICIELGITLKEVAYIGDDVNCFELLSKVGVKACPKNSLPKIKSIPGIIDLDKLGGEGAVREFIEIILENSEDN